MGRAVYHMVFVPAIVAGLFMGIYIKTGQDISSEGIGQMIIDKLPENLPQSAQLRDMYLWITAGSTVVSLITILVAGWLSIIIYVFGFLGMLLLVVSAPLIGLIFLLIGEVLSLLAPDARGSVHN